jgi:hypothetical protein
MDPSGAQVTAQQAVDALHEVERTERRLSIFYGYERGAPYFLLWGVIWILGYSASALLPTAAGPAWLALDVIGVVAGLFISRATSTGSPRFAYTRRYVGASVAIVAFVAATYYVLRPHLGIQLGAFPPLLMALIYVLVGLWSGSRWIAVGMVLGALTLLGYAVIPQYFMLWMASVGGGTLLLTGIWMRRA